MNIKVRLSSVLIVAVVFVMIFAVFQTQASAKNVREDALAENASLCDQSNILGAPIVGGPGFVSIIGATFTPISSDMLFFADNLLYNSSATSLGIFNAPVLLPQGASVNKLVAYYYDGSAANLIARLYRIDLGSGERAEMASVVSQFNWGNGAVSNIMIDFNVIDNQSYAYYAQVVIPTDTYGDLGLIGMRVDYTFSSYLPCITR